MAEGAKFQSPGEEDIAVLQAVKVVRNMKERHRHK